MTGKPLYFQSHSCKVEHGKYTRRPTMHSGAVISGVFFLGKFLNPDTSVKIVTNNPCVKKKL